jgi:hypothetical protein
MDLKKFVNCLTKSEKEELLNVLKTDLEVEGGSETLEDFLERQLDAHKLSTRLVNVLRNSTGRHRDYYSAIIGLSVKDVTFDDLTKLNGAGQATWEEFVKLRGF